MRTHLLALLLSLSLYACTPEQSSPTVEPITYSLTLADGVFLDDITNVPFTSPELETIRLGLKSGGNVILTESEHQRLVEYAEVVKGVTNGDAKVTTFIGQLSY